MTGGPVTISPDGERLAFAASDREGMQLIWVRGLGSSAAQPLPGTDGGAYPFWSPDSQTIGFFAQRKLKTVRLSGGAPQTLCDAVLPRGGTWSRDGVIVFSAGAGRQLYRVSATGGTATPFPTDALNRERHWPSFLPDGRHFRLLRSPAEARYLRCGDRLAQREASSQRLRWGRICTTRISLGPPRSIPRGPGRRTAGLPIRFHGVFRSLANQHL